MRKSCFHNLAVCLSLLMMSGGALANEGFPNTRQAALDVSQAFGFVYGQATTLDYIDSHFPELAAQVMIAEKLFSITYSGAENYLASTIAGMVGEEGKANLIEHFDAEVSGVTTGLIQDRNDASAFLAEVHARAQGQIPSPMREVILAASYHSHPEQELLDGHGILFSTSGHAKSMGLDVSVKRPLSWVASEGRRPHVVQKWRNLAGHGQAEIMLLIQDLGVALTSAEVEELMEVEDFSAWVPEGSEYLGTTRLRIDNQPAVGIDYLIMQDMGPITVVVRSRQYQIFVGDKTISLQCQARAGTGSGPTGFATIAEARDSALATFAANERLCYLTGNSIVVDQLWR